MKRELIKRIIATLMLIIIAAMPIAGVTAAATGGHKDATRFVIDWTDVELTQSGKVVPYFAVLKDDSGYYFYIISNTEYESATMYILHDDKTFEVITLVDEDEIAVYDKFGEQIEGASLVNRYEDDARCTEIYIPASYIPDTSFKVISQDCYYVLYEEVNGQDRGIVWSDAIKDALLYMAVEEYVPEKPKGFDYYTTAAPTPNYDNVEGNYSGIMIDGVFYDWTSIGKTSTNWYVNSNRNNKVTVDSAIVWDGDYAYIYMYLRDTNSSNHITDTNTVSQFPLFILTDSGRSVSFTIEANDINASSGTAKYTVSGLSDALVGADYTKTKKGGWFSSYYVYDCYYEVAIPSSYFGDTATQIILGAGDSSDINNYNLTSWVANINPGTGDDDDDDDDIAEDIVIDGVFGDWAAFPQTNLYHCTNNAETCNCGRGDYAHVGHSTGSAYLKDDKIVAHIKSYSGKTGNQVLTPYLTAITLRVNDTYEISIVTNETQSPNGNYRYMILQEAGNSTPLGELQLYDDNKTIYEYEYYLSIDKLAEIFNIGPTEFRTIELYYPYIGYQCVKVAGTSTAPYVGIAICFAVVGLTWFVRYMKDKRTLG